MHIQKNIKCVLGQYLKFVLFSAPDQPLENCVWKYFLGDSVMSSLKIFWLPEIMAGSFRYCSRIYAWNWFTLFYMIKICCSTWAVTRFLSWIWMQHSYFRGKPTDPLTKWRVECGKRRYIQGWPLFHMLMIIYKFLLCFSTTVKLVLATPSV